MSTCIIIIIIIIIEQTFIFQYQLKLTLLKYDSHFRHITQFINKQRSNDYTSCIHGNCIFHLCVSIGLILAPFREIDFASLKVVAPYCGAWIMGASVRCIH